MRPLYAIQDGVSTHANVDGLQLKAHTSIRVGVDVNWELARQPLNLQSTESGTGNATWLMFNNFCRLFNNIYSVQLILPSFQGR